MNKKGSSFLWWILLILVVAFIYFGFLHTGTQKSKITFEDGNPIINLNLLYKEECTPTMMSVSKKNLINGEYQNYKYNTLEIVKLKSKYGEDIIGLKASDIEISEKGSINNQRDRHNAITIELLRQIFKKDIIIPIINKPYDELYPYRFTQSCPDGSGGVSGQIRYA